MSDEIEITWDNLDEFMQDLRRIAQHLLARENNAQSIQVTGLIDSALLKFVPGGTKTRTDPVDWNAITWENKSEFFAAVYHRMTQVLIDHARKRNARVTGIPIDPLGPEHIDVLTHPESAEPERIEAVLSAIEILQERHPDWTELIHHIYYSGYTIAQAAQIMEIPEARLKMNLRKARVLIQHHVESFLNQSE